jgi:hypothetical protein
MDIINFFPQWGRPTVAANTTSTTITFNIVFSGWWSYAIMAMIENPLNATLTGNAHIWNSAGITHNSYSLTRQMEWIAIGY